jgi:hypothetical protein
MSNRLFDTSNDSRLKGFTPLPSNPQQLTRDDALKVFTPQAVAILVKEVNRR